MLLIQKLRNKICEFLKSYGTTQAKKQMWDAEFTQGTWNYLDITTNDPVYQHIAKSIKGGSILDLGCGTGNTANELDENAYRNYVGVDISSVAIERARKRTKENGRASKSRFFQSDVADYVPNQQFDVILFRESIYYIPRERIKTTLERYSKYLKKNGTFIMRMYSKKGKFKGIITTIEKNFEVIEKCFPEANGSIVLVFQPRAVK